ncbi:hypothetical protein J2I46_06145 [Fibrella sp. HMF5405]|uniref:SD-repeat containing protein B domain-containing protein n=1 Tax=Fibrella forsythiae TaxID=2817061 RepID=A0ABS3JDS8_9BACT|nr:hypothetical protein [Fibrella forsythiae]
MYLASQAWLGVRTRTYKSSWPCNSAVATTTTNASGPYSFTGLTSGTSNSYSVGFTPPAGYNATISNVGSDTADSDADPITGNTTLDVGFVKAAYPPPLSSPRPSITTEWQKAESRHLHDLPDQHQCHHGHERDCYRCFQLVGTYHRRISHHLRRHFYAFCNR